MEINLCGGRLYQWDVNRKIEIYGYSDFDEVHFALENDTESLVVIPSIDEEKTYVTIPNILLTESTMLNIYIVQDGQVIKRAKFWIFKKSKPSEYVYMEDETYDYVHRGEVLDIIRTSSSCVNNEAKGTSVVLKDGAEMQLDYIRLYGKTTQTNTTGKNLLDPNNFVPNTELRGTGEIVQNNRCRTYHYLPIDKNTDYTIYVRYPSGYLNSYTDVLIYDENKNRIGIVGTIISGVEISVISFNSGENGSFLSFSIFENPIEIQFEKNQTATPYEPYTECKPSPSPEYLQEYTSVGDDENIKISIENNNLLDISKYTKRTDFDLSEEGFGFWKIILEVPSGLDITVSTENNRLFDGYLCVLNNTMYGNNEFKEWLNHYEAGTHLQSVTIPASLNNGVVCLIFSNTLAQFQNCINTRKQIQVEIGSVATACRLPEQQQSLITLTENGLHGIPVTSGGNVTINGQQYISDYIEMNDDGSGKLYKYSYEITLNGQEFIDTYNSTGADGFYVSGVIPEPCIIRSGFCTSYKVDSTQVTEGIWIGQGNDIIYFHNNSFYDEALPDKGLANFKTHLAENPVKILTYVTTPIITDLNAEEVQAFKELHTNYPTTVITNSGNAYMEVGYKADTKNYIDKKFDELATALIASAGTR